MPVPGQTAGRSSSPNDREFEKLLRRASRLFQAQKGLQPRSKNGSGEGSKEQLPVGGKAQGTLA
jgi:hypothetical protein